MDVPMSVDISGHPLTRMFSRHPIYDNVFSRLSPRELIRMSSVNRVIHSGVQDFSLRAYNVNRRLSRSFGDSFAFRSLMARTHMVISGSFALQLFDRTYYPDSDLDLYVHPDRSIAEVGLWLEKEGYTYLPREWQRQVYRDEAERILANIDLPPEAVENDDEAGLLYNMRSVRAVYSFERSVAPNEILKVQIVVSRLSPLASILDFHSTCVMNVITYNAAYSLYPHATFARREALIIHEDFHSTNSENALAKYSSRGWRMLARRSPLLEFIATPGNPLYAPWWAIDQRRWVCDSRSWVIHFDTTGVTAPPPPSVSSPHPGWDPVAECGWKLELQFSAIAVKHVPIKTTILRWRYTAPDEQYIRCIVPFFYNQGNLEHRKVPEGQSRDSVRDAWTWWDYMLPLLRLQYCNAFPDLGSDGLRATEV
ncbi:hypothetical protein DICSQDRAFT_89976 [Dichomitus squalens LYAD-421 SS1]|uniref:F-box domain-containing protein n=1 Tax=Dichomitus squalens (strain LYAD-421) TaxID=732165 RepID=R7SSG4_DICSQ|nr:uncharacterized protein DICSQDRAFT_89976 [Dichomitus squalens LYAD-421 SS1]EJF59016.1 hypothetical protein DICSQDRAFT_89976 [Dichomitus squalens LYAD-421 SS1]